jgi:O-antigen/teichoic acid export membrane protein
LRTAISGGDVVPEQGRSDGSQRATGPQRASAASATIITYGTNLLVAVLSLANVLIVSRTLGPTGRGEVAFLTAIAFFSSSLFSAGIEESNANLGASEPSVRRSLATNSVVLALMLGALAVAAVQGLIAIFPGVAGPSSSDLRWLTLGFLPVLILNLYLRWLVRADYAFAVTNVALLITPIANVTVNGVLAVAGLLTVGTAVSTWLGGQAIGTVILAWYVTWRLSGFGRPDPRLMRSSLAFGLKTHAGRVMLLGNWRLDQWLLGAISGARELGLYSVAVAWTEALSYLPTAVKFVQRPYLVRSSQRDAARQAAFAFRAAFLVTVVLGVGMILAAPVMCVTFFGSQFHGSIVELRLLVLGALGMLALTIFGNALVARRRPVLSSVALAAGFVCTLVLDVLLIPPYAGVGAAVASAISYTAAGAMMSLFFVRALGESARELVPRLGEAKWLMSRARRTRPVPGGNAPETVPTGDHVTETARRG